jgi:hypothetical protein
MTSGVDSSLAAAHANLAPLLAAWRDSGDLLTATCALGFDPLVASRGLEAELEAWADLAAFERVWRRDLGLGEAPVARFPREVLVIAARTLPASAMRQILWARALGAEVLLKPASGQEAVGAALCPPHLSGLTCLAAARSGPGLEAAFSQCDAVIVLGNDTTVREVAARLRPVQRLVAYGHRTSAALVAAPLSDDLADGLAQDLAAWDQSGCLSPRTLWVHGADDHAQPLDAVSAALTRLGSPPLPASAAHAQRVAVTRALMTGVPVRQAGGWVLAWTEPAPGEPLPRWLTVAPFTPERFMALRPHLSTLGLGPGVPEDLIGPPSAARSGGLAADPPPLRVCRLGEMQRPPLDWCQDGHLPLRALLRGP